ncbi:hypothetical protein SEVIR_7G333850v4 [Setaria viridis]
MFNKVDFDKQDILYIDTLKDDALSIGHNYSCCLPNHVYFTDDDDEYSLMDDDGQYYRRDVGMYNLEDNSVIETVSPQPWLNWPIPVWISINRCLYRFSHDVCIY